MATQSQASEQNPPAPARHLGFAPSSHITGELRTPGSKSAAQRALVAALLAHGESRILGLPDGADVTAAVALVKACGAEMEWLFGPEKDAAGGGALRIVGMPPQSAGAKRGPAPTGAIRLGESGTLARIATASLALCVHSGGRVVLLPQGSLTTRSSRALFDSLLKAGAVYVHQNLPGTWPVDMKSVSPPSTLHLVKPSSSQEVSALLIAAAAWPDCIDVVVDGPIPSLPYVGITRQLLEEFGVGVEELIEVATGPKARRTYSVSGPLTAPPSPLMLEPDASSAAVALAAACLSGGALTVPGLRSESAQGDVRIVEHLAAFGCDARADAEGLHATGFPTQGAQLDLGLEPDLAPVLAAVAGAAALRSGSHSLLLGLHTLPGKESDRIQVLGEGLRALGLSVEAGSDRISIGPGPGDKEPEDGDLVLDPQGDHRMAFAFALLGLVQSGVYVSEPMSVAKSWRGFWDDLSTVGAVVQERQG